MKASNESLLNRRRLLRRRLAVWVLLSFFVTALPITVLFIARSEIYFREPRDVVRLSLGGIMIAGLFFLRALGKLHMPRRAVAYGLALLLLWLLDPIVSDLKLLTFAALCGEAVDCLLLAPQISRMRENLKSLETADVTAGAVKTELEALLSEYRNSENGRV